tara:strand:+ start:3828 stop:4061 length:234 start_codon:yes stop_codon:yes gene_type:complete
METMSSDILSALPLANYVGRRGLSKNQIKDYRHVTSPKVYMTQDNDRNENGEQSNDSVEANHMINTNKIIEETQENL